MASFSFQQVDVFTGVGLKGNPLAVVVGADGLSDATMAAFANWTNLSETTFLLKPTQPSADYRVRIFTPERELPFAGHPTLGSCQVWLSTGNTPKGGHVVQECAAGLIRIKRDGDRLASPRHRCGVPATVEEVTLGRIAKGLGIERSAIKASQWIDNGPGWLGVMLASRAVVLGLNPDHAALSDLKPGVVGPWEPATDGSEAQFEVRALRAQPLH